MVEKSRMDQGYDNNGLLFANIQGQPVDNFANPWDGGRRKAAGPGLHRQSQHFRFAIECRQAASIAASTPLRKLRVCNPSGCFALDGGGALAFLAR
jgi:hypothetical protein